MTAARRKKSGKEASATIGIIGGSGLYSMPGLKDTREIRVKTPFGEPSDAIVVGTLEGKRVAFLARHGRGHRILPSEINFRANICAMKQLGVERIISVSAVGSLQEDLRPGEFLVVDQFVDRTKNRMSTFFGGGLVAHVTFDKPTCGQVSAVLADASVHSGVKVHRRGTYVCIEGPQFSSRAESLDYKAADCDVIGMTAMPEAKLAREAEISYATIAMVTDFDCWHPKHDNVDVASVIRVVEANAGNAATVLARLLRDFPAEHEPCPIGSDRALDHALLTPAPARDPDLMKKLEAIMQRVNRS